MCFSRPTPPQTVVVVRKEKQEELVGGKKENSVGGFAGICITFFSFLLPKLILCSKEQCC